MTPLLAMVRANVTMSLRNRTALFWNLAFPALFIVIFGVVFGRGATVQFDVGVAGPESAYQDQVIAALQANPTFVVTQGDEAAERQALQAGDRAVGAGFGKTTQGEPSGVSPMTPFFHLTEGTTAPGAAWGGGEGVVHRAGGPPTPPVA